MNSTSGLVKIGGEPHSLASVCSAVPRDQPLCEHTGVSTCPRAPRQRFALRSAGDEHKAAVRGLPRGLGEVELVVTLTVDGNQLEAPPVTIRR